MSSHMQVHRYSELNDIVLEFLSFRNTVLYDCIDDCGFVFTSLSRIPYFPAVLLGSNKHLVDSSRINLSTLLQSRGYLYYSYIISVLNANYTLNRRSLS